MSNASSGPGEPLYPAIRQMAFETISHLGSRSFSHFLNATERYSDVLRFLTPDFASRRILLDAVNSYWRRSSEMRLVTLDKYLQYGILEGIDIIEWIFADDEAEGEEGDGWTDGDKWEVLSMCLEKHLGRVKAISRRLKVIPWGFLRALGLVSQEAIMVDEAEEEDEVRFVYNVKAQLFKTDFFLHRRA